MKNVKISMMILFGLLLTLSLFLNDGLLTFTCYMGFVLFTLSVIFNKNKTQPKGERGR